LLFQKKLRKYRVMSPTFRTLLLVLACLFTSNARAQNFIGVHARFIEVFKHSTTDTQLHIGEIEAFGIEILPDEADGDGTSSNDLVQNSSPSIEIPPTTQTIQHGAATSVFDGDQESAGNVWSTLIGTGVEPRFMLDLGANYEIGQVRIWGRNDTCCGNRLQNFSVNLYADEGDGLPGTMDATLYYPDTAPAPGKVDFEFAMPNPGILAFDADTALTFAGQALTLSWELHADVTNAFIDTGIGEILSRTTNDIGQLTLTPGPSLTTTYTLTAIRPASTNTAQVTVEVTDKPIITSFTASTSLAAPGEELQLSWIATNAVSLQLNGVDVTGTTSALRTVNANSSFTLIATNPNGSTSRQVQITVLIPGEPVISEFMADPQGEYPDEDGDDSDWIEIWNPTADPVLLEGYHLSDDPQLLNKWTFPARTINPGEYLVLFASAKNRTGAVLHANFQLDAGGEFLALTAPDGFSIRTVFTPGYPAQRPGVSFGYDTAYAIQGYMSTPTPGTASETVFLGFVKDTTFSASRGFYDQAFDLVIATDTPGAAIHFTTNGTLPTASSGLLYANPIPISRTTIVRAIASLPGRIPTNVDTQTYLFRDDIIAQPTMLTSITQDAAYGPQMRAALTDIPSISLVFPGGIERTEKACSIEFINFESGHTQLDAGMVRFGNFVTDFPKRQMRISFRRQYGKGKLNFPLFRGFDHGITPVEVFDQLDIRSGSHDMSQRGFYMSARFTDDTMLEMGHLHSHGRFVHVYVNGRYNGQYHLRERWNASMHAEYLGGKEEDYEAIVSNRGGFPWSVGTPYDGDGSTWATMLAKINDYDAVRPYLDVPEFVDWLLLWMSGNSEWEHRAVGPVGPGSGFNFLMNDPDGFLRAIGDRTDSNGPHDIFTTLRGHPDFDILVADRIHRNYFNDGAFTPARNIARLITRTTEIERAFLAESARWNFRTPSSWAAARDSYVDNNFPTLTQTMITRFRNRGLYPVLDAPVLSQHGGRVPAGYPLRLQSGGVIYYTTDGSDPRLPGGGISPLALSMDGGGNIGASMTSNRTFIARGATWRYLDDGSDQGTAWTSPTFDDQTWASGPAELGYGDGDEVTTVSYGPSSSSKYITTYFRHTFSDFNSATNLLQLAFNLRADDGAVIHVNGVEARRYNMPTGATDYLTPAEAGIGGTDETTTFELTIGPALFQAGSNTVAVEVHQVSPLSSDISFDLDLVATHHIGSLLSTNGPVLLTQDTLLKARAFDGTWSALTETTFEIDGRVPADAGNLVLSEIHYNPDGDDDAEFIEFVNISTNTLDLSGLTLSNAVDFTFPQGLGLDPGALLVITRNASAFSSRYQDTNSPYFYPDIQVVGQWLPSISLDNNGDTLVLFASNGTELLRFRYDDDGAWPGRADGDGSSLELKSVTSLPGNAIERNTTYANPANWQASCTYQGSPGRLEACSEVVINELLTNSELGEDWIEFYNPGPQPADIGGWFLSDTPTNLTRFRIPDNTSVPGQGYLILEESGIGFAFSQDGEQATLSTYAGTNLTAFVDQRDFGPAAPDISFGRYLRSDGAVEFPALRFPTRAGANAYPLVGPVVISEIMYHPTNGIEFIELANITGDPIPLFDPSNPTSTWTFSSGIQFTFPTNTFLEPWDVMLVTATNPATFRAVYTLPAFVQIFGPWQGSLNNSGESLKLRKPGTRELDGSVPAILADKVEYEPRGPWPMAADGLGPSLERILLYAYGNDPINWRASNLSNGTPGYLTSGTAHLYIAPDAVRVINGEVTFSALAGQRYQVEYSDTLNGNWQVLAILTASSDVVSVIDPEAAKRRYYRVLWIP
jgi:hypothetical protein